MGKTVRLPLETKVENHPQPFPLLAAYDALSAPAMRSKRVEAVREERGGAWLTLAVHLDAFRAAPRPYLAALWWRLTGKRLRARSRFAPLLGLSPKAYRLWMRTREVRGGRFEINEQSSPIFALIDCGQGTGCPDATMRSLDKEGLGGLIVDRKSDSGLEEVIRSIDWKKTPWLMPLAAGDVVARGAASAYRAVIDGSKAQLAYADDDLLNESGRRIAPHFKPTWNSELFRHFDYLTGACVIRTSPDELISLPFDDWRRQLTLLAASRGTPIHVPHVLHHRRSRPRPQLPAPIEIDREALPSVSVIVPTRNRLDLLRPCLEGLARTNYPDFEVLVVDNDSDDPATLEYLAGLDQTKHSILRHSGPFNFSAINNRAVKESRGSVVCLLNNDVEVLGPDWLLTMVVQALRNDVGAVGAQLLYPDGRTQHAGVVLGICGGAAHAHRFLRPNEEGYFQRHLLPQFVSAVTAACMVVRRDRFLAVGGFDVRNFPVAFNDVDICMRLNQRGWQSLYEPRARLIHRESVSRGKDREPTEAARFARELAALKELWSTNEEVDPFHHPELSPFSEQFVVRL